MSQGITPKQELLKCPFCGSTPKLSLGKIAPGWWQIECVQATNLCGAYLYVLGKTEEEATARWNRKPNTGREAR